MQAKRRAIKLLLSNLARHHKTFGGMVESLLIQLASLHLNRGETFVMYAFAPQIFKLAQGEYIAVERVEANYKKLPIIQQIFGYGNSMESVLVAVVVPEEPLLIEAAKKEGISFDSYTQLLGLDATRTMLLKQMDAVAKEFKMKASLNVVAAGCPSAAMAASSFLDPHAQQKV